jgi:hypothetical protein
MTWGFLVYLVAGWSHALRSRAGGITKDIAREKSWSEWSLVLTEILLWFPIIIRVAWLTTRKKEKKWDGSSG